MILSTQDKPLTRSRIVDALVGKIGFVRSQKGVARCTAFCLSKTLIATAGHCLRAHPSDAESQHRRLIFEPSGAVTTSSSQRTRTRSSRISGLISGGRHVSFRKPIEADQDWAILKLRTPVCTRGGLTLASRDAQAGTQKRSAHLFAPRVVIQTDGRAVIRTNECTRKNLTQQKNVGAVVSDFSNPHQLMFHDCDAGKIASGAPILKQTTLGLEVVAMHVGAYVRSRVLEQDSAIIERVASKPIANIAIPVDAFVRPIKDLLQPGKGNVLSDKNK